MTSENVSVPLHISDDRTDVFTRRRGGKRSGHRKLRVSQLRLFIRSVGRIYGIRGNLINIL